MLHHQFSPQAGAHAAHPLVPMSNECEKALTNRMLGNGYFMIQHLAMELRDVSCVSVASGSLSCPGQMNLEHGLEAEGGDPSGMLVLRSIQISRLNSRQKQPLAWIDATSTTCRQCG